MPTFLWDSSNDYEYCEFTDCMINGDTIILDNKLIGTVVSDIRDTTAKKYMFNELVMSASVPTGTACT
ncbi:MAG: hypothetical protein MJB12_04690, partial [Firmicutes bacterium]|nr:hypothetical protein [Bacillota bacterium]